jgi:anhydro-N-acetylmuramic acid kinase
MQLIGLMSGTSIDGVDGVLVDITDGGEFVGVLSHTHRPFDPALRHELLALNTAGGTDELRRAERAANGVSAAYAGVVNQLLASRGRLASDITAIGAHGQTVRHQPDPADPLRAYTTQLLNGALLAELTGIDVVCDLRSRDVAAGGQGAPLVPAFHAAVFRNRSIDRAVVNLGGIANLTLLPSGGAVTGFDCGPANGLMDGWCERHTGARFDDGGRWAASAAPDAALLAALASEPYFAAAPPKSTGRDLFHLDWLDAKLARFAGLSPAAVQSTLCSLTAASVAGDLRRYAPTTRELYACGGGAFNAELMRRLAQALPSVAVDSTAAIGLPPNEVEASAFAWLAHAFVRRLPGNLPSVTGARGPRILGALYPGNADNSG